MYFACIVDRWTDELFTADECDTYAEAEQFIRDELSSMVKATEKAVILTKAEYEKERERF
jgi:hypothetical protein